MDKDHKVTLEHDILLAVETMKKVFADMDKDFTVWEYRTEILNLLKAGIFVNHINRHLEPHQRVICKICGRNIDTIYREEKGY